jgi:hypothetical protein
LQFFSKKLSLYRFLTDLAHFNGPELPVDRFSIAKVYFYLNTNNTKGFFFLRQHKAVVLALVLAPKK